MKSKAYTSICSFCERGFYVDVASKKIGYTKTKPKSVKNKKLQCCFPCFTKSQTIKSQCSKCKQITTIPGKVWEKHLGDKDKIAREVGFKHSVSCS